MIGMLVFRETGRQDDVRPDAADDSGQANGVRAFDFQLRVAVEFSPFQRCTQQRRGIFRFCRALLGGAPGAGFAARTYDQMGASAGLGFQRDHAAAAEFDVVRVRAKRQERRRFSGGFRCRLHRNGQWYHG